MRECVRVALIEIASRFSDDAPTVDERKVRSRYAAAEAWPADAELGLMVLSWALGPGFSIREFKAAVNRLVPDFARAAAAIDPGESPTLITLSGIARHAFANAAIVTRWNLPDHILFWPTDLTLCKVRNPS